MVNPVNGGFQPNYTTSQPSFTTGAEVKNTEQVQPRQAPAADTQRSDQKVSRDEDRKFEARERQQPEEETPPPERRADGQRGSLVDISA